VCGILYIHDTKKIISGSELAKMIFLSLSNLQHRGQDGGGFSYTNGAKLWNEKFFGKVAQFYNDLGARKDPPKPFRSFLKQIQERSPHKFLGHLRYPTAGGDLDLSPFQPHFIHGLKGGPVVFASNGDIPTVAEEKEKLERIDVQFDSDNDAELILRQVCFTRDRNKTSWINAIHEFMKEIPGAYSGVLMTKQRTFFIRDLWAVRPFLVGRTEGGVLVAVSESCALDIVKAKFEFEVERGSVIEIYDDGQMKKYDFPEPLPTHAAHCLFCLDYFARPDSKVFIDDRPFEEVPQKGTYAYEFGRELAREHPVEADCVVSVPHSGDRACRGYSHELEMKSEDIFIVNFSIPRTFIMTAQQIRELYVRLKFGILDDVIKKNPRVCIVDDSLVRATTLKILVDVLREKGAEEVHVRLSFPPITNPCFQGIAMPTKAELAASSRSIEEICQYIGADSIGYLSEKGLETALNRCGNTINDFCTACFTGKYPFPIPDYKLQR